MDCKCKLCEKESDLQKSHLYPKFVIKWLKDTSMNGFLRNSAQINRRRQDGPKFKWFCLSCEQILSNAEKLFSEKVFQPYVAAVESGEYSTIFPETLHGDYILRFAIGLQLRSTLATEKSEGLSIQQREKINKFVSHWREYLLNNSHKTGDCESHIFLLTPTKDTTIRGGTRKFPENINRYLVRALDNTIIFSDDDKHLGVYSKIGPVAFYTSIIPRRMKGLTRTKIAMKKNTLTCSQIFANESITNFLWFDRPSEVQLVEGELSDTQSKAISNSIKKNPQKALNSLGFRMYQLDTADD